MSNTKPFKGYIRHWARRYFDKSWFADNIPEANLGYIVTGIPQGHPEFKNWMRTSAVVYFDEYTNEIETLNSRYILVGEEVGS